MENNYKYTTDQKQAEELHINGDVWVRRSALFDKEISEPLPTRFFVLGCIGVILEASVIVLAIMQIFQWVNK